MLELFDKIVLWFFWVFLVIFEGFFIISKVIS